MKWSLLLPVIILCIFSFFAHQHPFFFFDPTATSMIQSFHPGYWTFFMEDISAIGSSWLSIPVILGVSAISLFWRNHKDALFILISSAGAYLLAELVKKIIERPRPDLLVHHFIQNPSSFSYPSEHVLLYSGFFGFILFLLCTEKRNHWLKTIGIFLLSLLLILVGISRVYLGVHWFSDVLGGYLFGAMWLTVMIYFYRKA